MISEGFVRIKFPHLYFSCDLSDIELWNCQFENEIVLLGRICLSQLEYMVLHGDIRAFTCLYTPLFCRTPVSVFLFERFVFVEVFTRNVQSFYELPKIAQLGTLYVGDNLQGGVEGSDGFFLYPYFSFTIFLQKVCNYIHSLDKYIFGDMPVEIICYLFLSSNTLCKRKLV